MSHSLFPTAQEVSANWSEQKSDILRNKAEDLQKIYADTAKFGPDGPIESSTFKPSSWESSASSLGARPLPRVPKYALPYLVGPRLFARVGRHGGSLQEVAQHCVGLGNSSRSFT